MEQDADRLKHEGDGREDELAEHFSKLSEIIIGQWASGSTRIEYDAFDNKEDYEEFVALAHRYGKEISDFIEDAGVEVAVAIWFRDYLHIK